MSDAADDQQRERVLAAYDVVDAPPRRELRALVDLAAQLAGVPFASVNLMGSRFQHQVATAGFTGEVTPRAEAMCREVVESGEPVLLEDASRDERWADSRWTTGDLARVRYYGSHPLRSPSGVVIGTLCVFDEEAHPVTPEVGKGLAQLAERVVDVLELELASRRLAEANARLSRSSERLAHFAGQVSHDLKNPLTSVSLSLEALELEVTDPYHVETVARARRGVERITGMIDDLLAFASQGSAPGDDLVDLDVEARQCLDDLAGRLDPSRVGLDVLPKVRGDAAQLRTVLTNLLDNAAKFTPEDRPPEIEVAAVPLGGRHRIEVRDRGRGVPAEHRERIFAPLTRLDKTVDGAGIGLADCRRIVEAHGGSVGVEERAGGGSVFWFELPSSDAAPA